MLFDDRNNSFGFINEAFRRENWNQEQKWISI